VLSEYTFDHLDADTASGRVTFPVVFEGPPGSLRDDILSGRIEEGDVLPSQDSLLAEFGVSPPALREAIHILETEGRISVRRGNVGGAIVHPPSAERTAHMISMVLQSRAATPADVSGDTCDPDSVPARARYWAEKAAKMPADGVVIAKEAFRLVEQSQAYQGEEVASYLFHAYGTNLQFEPGEFNFVKTRAQHGTNEAFRMRDEHFPRAGAGVTAATCR
jgi:DNA-binding IscR family transcriptional regulator